MFFCNIVYYKYKNDYVIDVPEDNDLLETTEKYQITIKAKLILKKVPTAAVTKEEILWEGTVQEERIYSLEAGETPEEAEERQQIELIDLLAEKSVIKIFEGW